MHPSHTCQILEPVQATVLFIILACYLEHVKSLKCILTIVRALAVSMFSLFFSSVHNEFIKEKTCSIAELEPGRGKEKLVIFDVGHISVLLSKMSKHVTPLFTNALVFSFVISIIPFIVQYFLTQQSSNKSSSFRQKLGDTVFINASHCCICVHATGSDSFRLIQSKDSRGVRNCYTILGYRQCHLIKFHLHIFQSVVLLHLQFCVLATVL